MTEEKPKTRRRIHTKSSKNIDDSSGGGYNGGMEARLAKLEGQYDGLDKRLSLIETDVRALSSKIDRHLFFSVASFASILAVLAKGFGWF